jgi:hypothetical protein
MDVRGHTIEMTQLEISCRNALINLPGALLFISSGDLLTFPV